jgi:regulator of protease activity HflC (stomatin/prohibitin superfamily)
MIKSDSVPSFFQKFRKELPDVEDGYLKNEVFDAYRIATNVFKADSLISNRNQYENLVKQLLSERITKQGYILSQLTTSLTPPKSLKDAIEAKNTAVQTAIQAENQVRTAEAQSKIQIVNANAAAKTVEIAANAEATANKLKQSTLTPMLIQQQWIEQWDGKLPTYMLGDKSPMMLNLSN